MNATISTQTTFFCICGGELLDLDDEWACGRCGRRYPISDIRCSGKSSDNMGNTGPIPSSSGLLSEEPTGCRLPELPAPVSLKTPEELRKLMKEDCGQLISAGPPHLTPSSSPSLEGCPPETRRKLCEYFNEQSYACSLDGTAWCADPYPEFCFTKWEEEQRKKRLEVGEKKP